MLIIHKKFGCVASSLWTRLVGSEHRKYPKLVFKKSTTASGKAVGGQCEAQGRMVRTVSGNAEDG